MFCICEIHQNLYVYGGRTEWGRGRGKEQIGGRLRKYFIKGVNLPKKKNGGKKYFKEKSGLKGDDRI